MELEEAIEKLANEGVEYADIAENILEGKGKVAEDCREYVEAIRVVLNHITKQEKMIESAKDRIEYYLMGNSTLNDFNEREKELEKLLKILNKAEEVD